MNTHKIKSTWKQGMEFQAEIDNHILITDSRDEEGNDNGPSPKRLMLASLAGCTGIDVVSILQKMKVDFSDFSIDVAATLSDEHPKIYKEVSVTYNIKLDELNQAKMQKAVALSQEKYCGVFAMFKAFASIDSRIIFL